MSRVYTDSDEPETEMTHIAIPDDGYGQVVAEWDKTVLVPEKDKEFRPVYLSLILNNADKIQDIGIPKYFSLYFVTPIFSSDQDKTYIENILIPYLRGVCVKKKIDWDLRYTKIRGLGGIKICGRLAASLIQGMMATHVPFLMNIVFIEG